MQDEALRPTVHTRETVRGRRDPDPCGTEQETMMPAIVAWSLSQGTAAPVRQTSYR
jgi:hypothetical protein